MAAPVAFSTSMLVALPFRDTADCIDRVLNPAPSDGVDDAAADACPSRPRLSAAVTTSVVDDLELLLDRCQRAVNSIVGNSAVAAAASGPCRRDSDASAAACKIAQLLTAVLFEDADADAMPRRLLANDGSAMQRLRAVVDALLATGHGATDLVVASPRREMLVFVHALADRAELKAGIASGFFAMLVRYMVAPPATAAAAATAGGDDEDDFISRRHAAHAVTSAVRGSAEAKAAMLVGHHLEPLCHAIALTPTGDFFLQLQMLEIVYRVTRSQPSVVGGALARALPEVLCNALATSSIANDGNFVGALVQLLDVYNAARGVAAQQQQQYAESRVGPASAVLSFRVDSFDISATYQPLAADSSAAAQTVAIGDFPSDTKLLLSSALAVLLVPGGNGANISFGYRQLAQFKLSRDHSASFIFRDASRPLLASMLAHASGDGASRLEQALTAQQHSPVAVTLHVCFDGVTGADVRASPLQAWVQRGLDARRRRAAQPQPQPREVPAEKSRPASRATVPYVVTRPRGMRRTTS